MKPFIYKSIAVFALFIAVFVCFSYYLRVKLHNNLYCAHPVVKTTTLKYESYHGSCCWMVGDRTDCWEDWSSPCGKAEGISPGYQKQMVVMDHTCDGSPSSFQIPKDLD